MKKNFTQDRVAVDEQENRKQRRRKKLKYGTMATAITAVVIVVVILLNVLVSMLGRVRLDLTTNHVYDISEETEAYVENLSQDVDIAISLDPKIMEKLLGTTKMMVTETLDKYQELSDHIHVQYFDTTNDPDVLSKYQDLYDGDIGSGSVIVASGNRCKAFSLLELFDIDSQKYYAYMYNQCEFSDMITGYKGEQAITNAIMNVTDANVKHVGMIELASGSAIFSVTQGNANAMEVLNNLLDDNGYDVTRSLDINNDTIKPEDYDILILPAPVNDLSTDAIGKLGDFLHNDGKLGKQLLYIADYTQGDTPNLNAFLKEWNLEVKQSIVVDAENRCQIVNTVDSYSSGRSLMAPVVSIATDEYSGSLQNTTLPIVAPYARPLTEIPANNGRVFIPLWQTTDTAYEVPLAGNTEKTEADSSDTAVYNAAVLVTNQITSNNELIESDLLVLGSMSLVDALVVSDKAYNNGEYVISALNTLCGKEASTVIASKNVAAATLNMTSGQVDVVKWCIWSIPVVVILVGIGVAVRRKRR